MTDYPGIDYSTFKEDEQLVNHIPNNRVVSHKKGLLKSLQGLAREKGVDITTFLPTTYCFDAIIDRVEWAKQVSAEPSQMWIVKPSSCNQGKGIRVLTSEEVNDMASKVEEDVRHTELGEIEIMQAYLERPLLLNRRKFDIRAFMLVANTTPYLVLGHNEFYARLSCEEYSTHEDKRGDRFVHLTNVAVQRKHPDYSTQRDDIVWSRDRFGEYLEKELSFPAKTIEEKVWPEMKEIMKHIFESARDQFERKTGYFDLFGIDFILDDELRPWVLELNTNPAMWTNCQVTKELCPKVIRSTLDLVLASHKKALSSDKKQAWPSTASGGAAWDGFEVLVDDSS